jgi:hypothetical protein
VVTDQGEARVEISKGSESFTGILELRNQLLLSNKSTVPATIIKIQIILSD